MNIDIIAAQRKPNSVSAVMSHVAKKGKVVVVATPPPSTPIVLQYRTFEKVLGELWVCQNIAGVPSLGMWPLRYFRKFRDAFKYSPRALSLSFGIPSQSLQHMPVTAVDDLGLVEWWGDPSQTHKALVSCMIYLVDIGLRR